MREEPDEEGAPKEEWGWDTGGEGRGVILCVPNLATHRQPVLSPTESSEGPQVYLSSGAEENATCPHLLHPLDDKPGGMSTVAPPALTAGIFLVVSHAKVSLLRTEGGSRWRPSGQRG